MQILSQRAKSRSYPSEQPELDCSSGSSGFLSNSSTVCLATDFTIIVRMLPTSPEALFAI